MIALQSKVRVDGHRGGEIFDFLFNATDREYQLWWPGVHLRLHMLKRFSAGVGNIVYLDEFVGECRLRMTAVVIEAVPGRKLVWQMKRGLRLPAWLSLELEDEAAGVQVTHTVQAGFNGLGRVFDPVFRLWLSAKFAQALDEHVKTEFKKLGEMLAGRTESGSTEEIGND